mmetsp:Transcript_10785/g.35427  ORF Transcript_10785/g.35427 Transcript_10785/m.35427 type:complete len:240 (-) Transcript_10785:172-891(-)
MFLSTAAAMAARFAPGDWAAFFTTDAKSDLSMPTAFKRSSISICPLRRRGSGTPLIFRRVAYCCCCRRCSSSLRSAPVSSRVCGPLKEIPRSRPTCVRRPVRRRKRSAESAQSTTPPMSAASVASAGLLKMRGTSPMSSPGVMSPADIETCRSSSDVSSSARPRRSGGVRSAWTSPCATTKSAGTSSPSHTKTSPRSSSTLSSTIDASSAASDGSPSNASEASTAACSSRRSPSLGRTS